MIKERILFINPPVEIDLEKLTKNNIVFDVVKVLYGQDILYFDKQVSCYEYKLIIFNTCLKNITNKDLLEEKFQPDYNFYNDLEKYYKEKGSLALILGNSINEVVSSIGFPKFSFLRARGGDIEYQVGERELDKIIFQYLKKPPAYYYKIDGAILEMPNENKAITNLNQDAIFTSAKYLTNNIQSDNLFFVPELVEYNPFIEELLRYLANNNSDLFLDYKTSDWVNSVEFSSNKLTQIQENKKKLQKSFSKDIQLLEKKEIREKENFSEIRNLLHLKGDKLKNSLKENLQTQLNLEVKDMDEERGNNRGEDLEFVFNKNTYITEVKGTVKKNPPMSYIQEVIKYGYKRQQDQDFEGRLRLILFLNHDINTSPDKRPLAYLEEENDQLLKDFDVLLISSFELFKLLKSVYDGGKSKKGALKDLLEGDSNRYQFKDK